jgi:hypothetical protein
MNLKDIVWGWAIKLKSALWKPEIRLYSNNLEWARYFACSKRSGIGSC